MYKKIIEHFRKVDPFIFKSFIRIKPIETLSKSKNFFSDLCKAIINQQLSGKAARTIFNRFKKLFPKEIITAEKLLETPDGKIREVGTSLKKEPTLAQVDKISKKWSPYRTYAALILWRSVD